MFYLRGKSVPLAGRSAETEATQGRKAAEASEGESYTQARWDPVPYPQKPQERGLMPTSPNHRPEGGLGEVTLIMAGEKP